VRLDGHGLTVDDVAAIAYAPGPVEVAATAWEAVARSRAVVDDLVRRGDVAYGVTTGFGDFARVRIAADDVRTLQRNLVMSHAAGVGPPLPRPWVRAMMAIRANTLAKGLSGVRRELVEAILAMLAADVVPVVPCRGSVGASGDLAPLAHLALPLIGLGQASLPDGRVVDGKAGLRHAGLRPLELEAKEGLALVNGTQMMSAALALGVHEARAILADAQVAAGMSLEALMGSVAPLSDAVHAARPHAGQAAVADNLRRLTADSAIVRSHADCDRVQDAYTLRCMPQVLGACRDVVEAAAAVATIEINAATDNPLVFPDGRIVSQGNFHGEPLAFHLDFLAIAMAEVASFAERRIERLVNPALSEGLPAFLVPAGGLNSGFMIAQYTAAALASENKVLAHPASVDSIPTSANQEDHVSMGSVAALKLQQVLDNVRHVVAIEALCAAQALDLRAPLVPGTGCAAAHKAIRGAVPHLDADRVLAGDIAAVRQLLADGALRNATAAAGVAIR
jgi:histidine ammonia-lyase